MHFNHPERTASKCKHSVHPSSSVHTPWCSRCITSAAQADLERTGKRLEAEGGENPPAYMRDRAWNVARIQYIVTKRRVKKTMQKDWLRQERERIWDEAHQRYLAQYGLLPPDQSLRSACVVCATTKKLGQPYAKPVVPFTTAWWERQGALVADQILAPRMPSRPAKSRTCPPQPRANRSSYLRNFIQSYRNIRAVSDIHRQAWEDRCKTERAVRRKYDLPDDFDIDPEFFAHPIPASHARYHHRQIQDGQHAGERRANRHKRRAEDYRPTRSSLALSELAEDVMMDDTEAEKLKLAEEDAGLRRLASVVASEVGYLYLVGDMESFEDWRYDIEQSNLSLIYRKVETNIDMGQLDEDHVETEEESEDWRKGTCVG